MKSVLSNFSGKQSSESITAEKAKCRTCLGRKTVKVNDKDCDCPVCGGSGKSELRTK